MLIHPLVRREMKKFIKKNKDEKNIFLEIPLLVESKLMKFFDIIIFIKANKKVRLKRFELRGGKKKLFEILNKKQMSDNKKIQYCDHTVVNEKNFHILKKKLVDIMIKYV